MHAAKIIARRVLGNMIFKKRSAGACLALQQLLVNHDLTAQKHAAMVE